jgi:hypothetical protein
LSRPILFRNLPEETGKNDKIPVGITGLSYEILTQYLPNGMQLLFPRGCDLLMYRVMQKGFSKPRGNNGEILGII